jgi:uncharacterized protein YycO
VTRTSRSIHRLAALVAAAAAPAFADSVYEPRAGDIVFEISGSAQAKAVRIATGATYTHNGVVLMVDGIPHVIEAGGKSVKYTTLKKWLGRENRPIVVKRLEQAATVLTPAALERMRAVADEFAGRRYDRVFSWSDDELYCTELVWKIFERGAGVEIGLTATMGDFDLSHPKVQAILRERYGDNPPLGETVISPSAMFAADALQTVYAN